MVLSQVHNSVLNLWNVETRPH
jgi:hypothetical protein